MTDNRRSRSTRNRKQSSPEVVARLQRSQRRALDRRAAMRDRERTVTAAVRDYISAWHAIQLVQERKGKDIANLRQRIDEVTSKAEEEVSGHEEAQAQAAAAIHAEGHSDDEIADLLETSPRRVRQLIARHRNGEHSSGGQSRSGTERPSEGVAEKLPTATETDDEDTAAHTENNEEK